MDAIKTASAPVAGRTLYLGNPRGFCAGVTRAITIVRAAIATFGPPVYVLHRIVHNDEVIATLRQSGAVFVDALSEIPKGCRVIFSAHGVPPAVRQEAQRRGLSVINATCPLVAKVHTEVLRFGREGRRVLLIGDRKHDEVKGVLGEDSGNITVIDPREDTARFEFPEGAYAVVSQTTLAFDETALVIAKLRDRLPDLVEPSRSDICYAVQNRQNAVKDLAMRCAAVIVVSSFDSNNGARLAEVAASHGTRSFLTPNAAGIDQSWLSGNGDIGIAAATSTPESSFWECVRFVQVFIPGIRTVEIDGVIERTTFPLPPELA